MDARSGTSLADITKSQLSTLQGAVIGLLALLLAFSFAMAESRFQTRQSLVVAEANAHRHRRPASPTAAATLQGRNQKFAARLPRATASHMSRQEWIRARFDQALAPRYSGNNTLWREAVGGG